MIRATCFRGAVFARACGYVALATLAGCVTTRSAPPPASSAPMSGARDETTALAPSGASTAATGTPTVAASGATPVSPTKPAPAASGAMPPSPPPPRTIHLASSAGAPDDAEIAAGDDAFERGDLREAEKHYQAAHASAPADVAPEVGLVRVRVARIDVPLDYASAKDNRPLAAAASDLGRLVKRAPSFGPAFVELGRCRLLLGDAPAAIQALTEGTRLLPNEPEAHSQLGVAFLATGRAADSVRELARATELDPSSPARLGNLGTALLMVGRTQEAITEYEMRVRLDDGDARAHSDLGTALLGTTDLERALSELRRAVSLDPGRASFHSNLGYALQQSGRADQAIAEYHTALRLDPKAASAWINLGTALARTPRTRREARASFERAGQLSPSDPRVKANLDELDALEKKTP